jgi:hypothetical protein
MSSHETQPRNHLTIHLPVKWVAFFVLGISLIVDAASIATRYEQLQYSAATYYHPYLVEAGLSDLFYIWYFLLMDSLLALVFAITGGIIALRGVAT